MRVAVRHGGNRQRPRYAQFGVVIGDCHVLGRVVLTIDPVRHVGWLGERLESMRAPGWHVQRDLLVVSQFEPLPVAVRRRPGPQVDDDVEDGPVRAAHQLGLAPAAAQVQAAEHATRRTGKAVLNEAARVDARGAHHGGIEGAAEEPPFVHVRRRTEQHGAGDPRHRDDFHGAARSLSG